MVGKYGCSYADHPAQTFWKDFEYEYVGTVSVCVIFGQRGSLWRSGHLGGRKVPEIAGNLSGDCAWFCGCKEDNFSGNKRKDLLYHRKSVQPTQIFAGRRSIKSKRNGVFSWCLGKDGRLYGHIFSGDTVWISVSVLWKESDHSSGGMQTGIYNPWSIYDVVLEPRNNLDNAILLDF